MADEKCGKGFGLCFDFLAGCNRFQIMEPCFHDVQVSGRREGAGCRAVCTDPSDSSAFNRPQHTGRRCECLDEKVKMK